MFEPLRQHIELNMPDVELTGYLKTYLMPQGFMQQLAYPFECPTYPGRALVIKNRDFPVNKANNINEEPQEQQPQLPPPQLLQPQLLQLQQVHQLNNINNQQQQLLQLQQLPLPQLQLPQLPLPQLQLQQVQVQQLQFHAIRPEFIAGFDVNAREFVPNESHGFFIYNNTNTVQRYFFGTNQQLYRQTSNMIEVRQYLQQLQPADINKNNSSDEDLTLNNIPSAAYRHTNQNGAFPESPRPAENTPQQRKSKQYLSPKSSFKKNVWDAAEVNLCSSCKKPKNNSSSGQKDRNTAAKLVLSPRSQFKQSVWEAAEEDDHCTCPQAASVVTNNNAEPNQNSPQADMNYEIMEDCSTSSSSVPSTTSSRSQSSEALYEDMDSRSQFSEALNENMDSRSQFSEALNENMDSRSRSSEALNEDMDSRSRSCEALNEDMDSRSHSAEALNADMNSRNHSAEALYENTDSSYSVQNGETTEHFHHSPEVVPYTSRNILMDITPIVPGGVPHNCVRCDRVFYMTQTCDYITQEPCQYHWGRLRRVYTPPESGYASADQNQQQPGRVPYHTYNCCGMGEGTPGCTMAKLHVWSGIEYGVNGPYDSYVRTRPRRVPPPDGNYGIYAIDCEMCFTARGLELTKVTVVASDGRLVYDSFVRPELPIIDYNTRFSGITERDLNRKGVYIKSLKDVQNDLMGFISADTVLIGHALENDLRALKILHGLVVDTALAFPHWFGLPYRRSLRSLVRSFLDRDIQTSSNGHNSLEDARACMELMLWRVRRDFLDQENP